MGLKPRNQVYTNVSKGVRSLNKKNSFTAYILIGIGLYFLIRQLDLPLFGAFVSWPTLLIIIGGSLLLHSYSARDYQHLFSGTVLLGLGIHFHGLIYYDFWIDHWAIYLLIVGIAFIIRFLRTKNGLLPGALLISIALLILFSVHVPPWLGWVDHITLFIEKFWPIVLIILGIFLLKKKK